MGARGPKSASELAVVPTLSTARPIPPDDLTERQADEWRRIVGRLPADWFPAETWPLLAAYCRHIVQARRIADLVNSFQPTWAGEDGGLERLNLLGKMQDREHRAMANLATKLRLTNQSRYDALKAGRQMHATPFGSIDGEVRVAPWERHK
jgi:hypothetical protein